MYDIHTHILPGIDDGADTLGDSLDMLRIAAENGTRGIVCTPHGRFPCPDEEHYLSEVRETLQKLRDSVQKHGIPLKLFAGQEIFLAKDSEAQLPKGNLFTLNGSRYLLCELDPKERAESAYRKMEIIRSRGYIPILAHPERYRFVIENAETVNHLKSLGVLIQIDKDSLSGMFGKSASVTAHRLLSSRKAEFIASDAHSPYIRTPNLADVHEMISELYSFDYANLLLRTNPQHVLLDREISILPAAKY